MSEDEMWVRFACAALAGHVPDDDLEGDELVDDFTDFAGAVADEMLEAFNERFTEQAPRPRRGSKRRGRAGRGSTEPAPTE